MKERKYSWHKVAESIGEINFAPNGITELEVSGRIICLALQKGSLFACSKKCPHAGGVLSDGSIDVLGNIVCPLHRYKFSLQSGRNISGEGYFLKTFPIEIRKEGVFVGFEENNWFNC